MMTKKWYQRSLFIGIIIGILQMAAVLVVLIPSDGNWAPFMDALKVEIAAIFLSIVALLKIQMDSPSVSLKALKRADEH